MSLEDVAKKWDKLANDYAAVSPNQLTNARSRFNNFSSRNGETVIAYRRHSTDSTTW